ncbi:MAG: PqqD family protein [Bacteroidales bacterium]|nr:PqqD family protein [Bacteroidales bacterium]
MKYRIEMEPLAGRYVVAFKDPDTGDLVKALALNRTAAEMLRMHAEGHDIPSIAHALSEKYGAPAEQIAADAESLFVKLEIN